MVVAAVAVNVIEASSVAAATTQPPPTEPAAGIDDPLAPRPLPEPTELTVAIPVPLEAFADLLLGVELGEYERENLDVTIEFVPVQEGLVLLDEGTIDVAQGAMQAGVLNLMASGSDIRWVFPLAGSPVTAEAGYWINTEAFGGDPADGESWKNQRILTPSGVGSVSAWNLWRHLGEIGAQDALQPGDLNFEVFAPGDMPQALASGAVGAALLVSPFQLPVVDDPCCQYIGAFPPTAQAGWLFGSRLLDVDRDVGEAFTRATARVWRDHLQPGYRSDDAVMDVLADVLDVPIERLRELPEQEFDLAFDLNTGNLGAQEFWFAVGDILSYDEPLDVGDTFDPSFIDVLGAEAAAP